MKKFHLLSVILGISLLGGLIWQIGLHALWHDMTVLGWGLIPLVLIEGVVDLFHTLGWRHCLSAPHRSLPLWRLYRIRLAGFSINHLTPTATLGGEVTKGTLLALHEGQTEAITAVLIGKLAFCLTQLLLVAFGSVFVLWNVTLPPGVWPALLVSSFILGAGIVGFLFVQRAGKLGVVIRWLVSHRLGGKALARAATHLNAVDEGLKDFYKNHPYDLPLAVIWHLFGMGCGILQTWLFLFLLTIHPSFMVAAGIWLLGSWFDLLTFAIPLGIGIQEGTRVLAFKAMGFSMVAGLAYGVTLRLVQLFWAGVGLIIYATLLTEKRRPKGRLAPLESQ